MHLMHSLVGVSGGGKEERACGPGDFFLLNSVSKASKVKTSRAVCTRTVYIILVRDMGTGKAVEQCVKSRFTRATGGGSNAR